MARLHLAVLLVGGLSYVASVAKALGSARVLGSTTLGPDPQTVNRLNGESFQQDALITFNGYQYAVFWTPSMANASVRNAAVSRRNLKTSTPWEMLILGDYNQTEDDGHDILSLGISRGDGTLHLGFDQHDNALHYRASVPDVATSPASTKWSPELFTQTANVLPGPAAALSRDPHFINVTYPKFVPLPSSSGQSGGADLLLEFRVGRSGLGDSWLYEYTPGKGWDLVGRYLAGVNSSAYINGLDFTPDGTLHVTWTYRDYINDTGKDVAVQAGPNGPENNHDLVYAYSPDRGRTWHNNWAQKIARVADGEPIVPTAAGITVFSIPKYGGILNQEAQTVDAEGRVHVLNRENTTGVEQWYHYWRSTTINWTRTPLPLPSSLRPSTNITGTPTVIGKRGKLVALNTPRGVRLLAVLPSNAPNSTALQVLASSAAGHFRDWTVAWETEQGSRWEPLVDRQRLAEGDGVLSLFLVNGTNVGVVDLDVSGL